MADRPLLFSGPMIEALLDGRKTQTRRILKPQPVADDVVGWSIPFRHRTVRVLEASVPTAFERCGKVPYAVGDRLWVKEHFADEHPLAVQEGRYSQPGSAGIPGPPPVRYQTIYRVDGEPLQIWRNHGDHPYFQLGGPTDPRDSDFSEGWSNYGRVKGAGIYWNQARFMPRRASRLTLIITDVRIERLKTLTDADAVAEGIERAADVAGMPSWKHYPNGSPAGGWLSPRESYRTLWDGLNAKRGFGWDTNPWIIALTFRTVKANIDKLELAA